MARKRKGAALYELLYKDKGKATAANGSIKLPAWWKSGEPQPQSWPEDDLPPPLPGSAAAQADVQAEAQAVPEAEPAAEAEPVLDAEPVPATGDVATVATEPELTPSPMRPDAEPAAQPAVESSAQAHAAAAGRPAVASPPMPFGARRIAAQQPAPGKWLSLRQGVLHLQATTFQAAIAVAVALCLLLGSFILGTRVGREEPPAPIAQKPGGTDNVEHAKELQANANVLGDRPDTGQGSGTRMTRGLTYIITQWFGTEEAKAQKVHVALAAKGLPVMLSKQLNDDDTTYSYYIRTSRGFNAKDPDERQQLQQMKADIYEALKEIARTDRSLMGIEPKEPWFITAP